jgi:preprotein translocase subunit SecA
MIGEKHRDIIFKKRLEYLDGSSPDIWQAYAEDLYKRAVAQSDEKKLNELQYEVILSSINEVWCDYLEYTSELRQGIHLRAVGGKNPAEEYNIDSELYFEGSQERLIDKVVEVLEVLVEFGDGEPPKLFKPKNARTFLMEESGDELVRKPILLNVFIEDEEDDEDYEKNKL